MTGRYGPAVKQALSARRAVWALAFYPEAK